MVDRFTGTRHYDPSTPFYRRRSQTTIINNKTDTCTSIRGSIISKRAACRWRLLHRVNFTPIETYASLRFARSALTRRNADYCKMKRKEGLGIKGNFCLSNFILRFVRRPPETRTWNKIKNKSFRGLFSKVDWFVTEIVTVRRENNNILSGGRNSSSRVLQHSRIIPILDKKEKGERVRLSFRNEFSILCLSNFRNIDHAIVAR